MHLLSFAKGALAMFWLVAGVNLILPFGEPLYRPLSLLAGGMLAVHVLEVALLHRRISRRPQPWLDRQQVLLFGVLHLRSLR